MQQESIARSARVIFALLTTPYLQCGGGSSAGENPAFPDLAWETPDATSTADAAEAGADASVTLDAQTDLPGDALEAFPDVAEASPLCPPAAFVVNDQTAGNQCLPRVATWDDGRFVAVWGSYLLTEDDTKHWTISGKIFSANGLPAAPEFIVDEGTQGTGPPEGQAPRVVALTVRGFMVVWDAKSSEDGSLVVRGRHFDSNGTPGAAFTAGHQSPVFVTVDQNPPAVISQPGGRSILAWKGLSPSGDRGALARLYDAGGKTEGGFVVAQVAAPWAVAHLELASLGTGGFVAAWQNSSEAGNINSARWFNSYGAPVGDPILIEPATPGNSLSLVGMTTDGEGRTWIAWGESPPWSGEVAHLARGYGPAAGIVGTPFSPVPLASEGEVSSPVAVAGFKAGGFVSVADMGPPGGPVDHTFIARRFDPKGTPSGTDVPLEMLPGFTAILSAATFPDGGFVVVGSAVGNEEAGIPSPDGDGQAVVAWRVCAPKQP